MSLSVIKRRNYQELKLGCQDHVLERSHRQAEPIAARWRQIVRNQIFIWYLWLRILTNLLEKILFVTNMCWWWHIKCNHMIAKLFLSSNPIMEVSLPYVHIHFYSQANKDRRGSIQVKEQTAFLLLLKIQFIKDSGSGTRTEEHWMLDIEGSWIGFKNIFDTVNTVVNILVILKLLILWILLMDR